MALTDQIFGYCERGLDAGFLAEPLNAVSNAMFFVAAALGWRAWQQQPADERGWPELALVGLVGLIGVGSTLFHTFATRWAAIADAAPIGLFMLAYMGYVLRRFCGFGWGWVAGVLALFLASFPLAAGITCGARPCLNGSVAYVPALLALGLVTVALARIRHPAWRHLCVATALFAVSLAARSVDRALCPYTIISGRAAGTHALWHVLNGCLLLVLLLAAIRHRERPAATGGGKAGAPAAYGA